MAEPANAFAISKPSAAADALPLLFATEAEISLIAAHSLNRLTLLIVETLFPGFRLQF